MSVNDKSSMYQWFIAQENARIPSQQQRLYNVHDIKQPHIVVKLILPHQIHVNRTSHNDLSLINFKLLRLFIPTPSYEKSFKEILFQLKLGFKIMCCLVGYANNILY